ncbi:protein KRI1 homolog [Palaemon carinicauda]|uniref:protein KRI1 homolog n=1 Tax=Palaemon carinicauda TaxID=392227 RepID=UPI0035B5F883
MPKHKDIFDCDSGEEDNFKINENYADRYDKWRYKEEYEKLKARADSLESSSDESSDEEGGDKNFGKPTNPEFDREFLMSIGTIHKHKEGNIDVKDLQFFTGDYRVEKEKEEKPMTLKDFERHVILERGGKFEEDDMNVKGIETKVPQSSEKIKFDDGIDDSDDDDGDGLLTSGLFKPKEETVEDTKEAPQNEAIEFVKGKKSMLEDEKEQNVLETVKSAWNSDKLSKKDKWLVDFFLNERYLEEDDGEGLNDSAFLDEEEMSEEDPEKEPDPLASQYKFRHQEPGDLIKRHPRHVSDTLRLKDEKRKARREAAKARQIQKKEDKRKEIELLKAMKYKEIEEKIEKIKEASGNDDIDLGDVNLEEDFDPAAHDAYMEKILGDNYYDGVDEEELPEFEDEIDESKYYDNWSQSNNAADESNYEEAEGDDCGEYYEDFNMDADYDPSKAQEEKKTGTRRKVRHKSNFSKALEKKKPLFDPNEKDFASYFDEYYKLDFEDVVGGIPCRFKYRKVEENNFGLTTGEILAAKNSDLNKWVGLKKILHYNRSSEMEAKERQRYFERAKHVHVKQKILPSLFDENPELAAEREREKRRLKNLKRKQKKWRLREGIEEENSTVAVNVDEKEQSLTEEMKTVVTENSKSSNKSKETDDKMPTQEEDIVEEGSSETTSDLIEKFKKKRMKTNKKMQAQEEVKLLDQVKNTNEVEETNTSITESSKKKRKHKDKQRISENDIVDESITESPKKKKKHKDKQRISENSIVDESITESPKKKKKHKDKQRISENDIVDESKTDSPKKKKQHEDKQRISENGIVDESITDSLIKKKKHKDKQTISKNGIVDESEIVDKLQSDKNMSGNKKKKSKDNLASLSNTEDSVGNPTMKQNGLVSQNAVSKIKTVANTTKSSDSNEEKQEDHEIADNAVTNIGEKTKGLKEKKSKKPKKFVKENSFKKKTKKVKDLKKMKHLVKKHKGIPYFEGISDARLEAYGQNPKKVKNRVFYGKDF